MRLRFWKGLCQECGSLELTSQELGLEGTKPAIASSAGGLLNLMDI